MSERTPELPEIDGEACVHALAPHASCRACVDACPLEAWILDDDGLALDTARCDGCALCVPACPRAAIDLSRNITVLHDPAGRGTAWVVCERATTREATAMLCVHAIGPRDLERLSGDGVIEMHVLTGACAGCPRGGRSADLFAALETHRQVRVSNGQAFVSGARVDTLAFDRSLARAREDHEQVNRGRRRLFGAFVPSAEVHPVSPPPGQPLALCQPVIDGARCVACDACVRNCPDGALRKQEGDHPAYVIIPERCTGCRLCIDACDQTAVSLALLKPATLSEVSLDTGRCKACGVRYYGIRGTETGGSGYCRICSRTNHHKNLFQVFGDE